MKYIPLLILFAFFAGANILILIYDKPKKKPRPLTIPPRALLFGRIEGEEISIEGPYELKYLRWWERKMWKQKNKKHSQTTDKKGKKLLNKLLAGVKTTK